MAFSHLPMQILLRYLGMLGWGRLVVSVSTSPHNYIAPATKNKRSVAGKYVTGLFI